MGKNTEKSEKQVSFLYYIQFKNFKTINGPVYLNYQLNTVKIQKKIIGFYFFIKQSLKIFTEQV